MTGMSHVVWREPIALQREIVGRSAIIAAIAFLTLIDLFGSQALVPMLTDAYGVTSSTMGVAVNASAVGMALASLSATVLARRFDRRVAITLSLALLSVPTALLALMPDLRIFIALRVLQGVFMAAAFTLTLTYLSERCAVTALGGAMAAFITGNVAANLFGRLLASSVADYHGVGTSFMIFAGLNLVGAALAWWYFRKGSDPKQVDEADRDGPAMRTLQAWVYHLTDARLGAAFVLGFLILFVFVAAFTYANFELTAAPLGLAPMSLGLVYFVFLPSLVTTPLAPYMAARLGDRRAAVFGLLISMSGLALMLSSTLLLFLSGMALCAIGLYLTQSVATAFLGRHATRDRASANGLYLACYYTGGIAGAWLIGVVHGMIGWDASVAVLLAALGLAILTLRRMKP